MYGSWQLTWVLLVLPSRCDPAARLSAQSLGTLQKKAAVKPAASCTLLVPVAVGTDQVLPSYRFVVAKTMPEKFNGSLV